MEPPLPKTQMQAKKDFSIQSDINHQFSLELIKTTSTIEILCSYKDELLNHIYKTEFSLEDLKKINRYFVLFETIDEIYDDLVLLLDKKNTQITEENKNIKINIPLESIKLKEIEFTLKEEVKNDNETIQQLFSLVYELKKEIKEVKDENIELKTRISNLENYIEKQKELKEEKKNINSSIIKENTNGKNTIINWIKEKIKINKIKFEKIFEMNSNGTRSEDFHRYCDNKGPTLTLVKTTKNKIFGGFTPLDWDCSRQKK